MSLRCLIIDDEPLAHEVILTHLGDIPFLEVVGQCYRATDAFDFLSKNEIDLVFLDIRMPKLSGLDFIKTLKRKPIIIITSAFEEYALESFDLDVCDYLLKPFRFDRLLKAANRALEIYQLKNQTKQVQIGQTEEDHIAIKADKRHIIVKLNELYYLESLGNYVKVWKDKEFLLTQRTLTSFESQLPKELFIRVHKSYIVNKKFVHYLEGNMIILKNSTQIPIGKNFKPTIKQLLDIDN
ncbi:MAG TPA: LytTR family DNA-binding domain-containing protein [Pedobacter sp.]|nr:LytTR family DNA-binding domain-containing protein [Pedobacter sp.]